VVGLPGQRALQPEAAGVLLGHASLLVPMQENVGRVVMGKNDGGILREVTTAHVGVVEGVHRHIVVLQHPAGPPLIHARHPRLVDADAGLLELVKRPLGLLRKPVHIEPVLFRDGLDAIGGAVLSLDHVRTRPQFRPVHRDALLGPVHGGAVGQQLIHRLDA